MGQSTDGCLAYGLLFGDDDDQFPWSTERNPQFDGDIEEWWRAEQGIDASKGYPAEGWYEYQQQFDKDHPMPVVLENYCAGEYPMWMLAIPASTRSASRGEPEMMEAWPTVTDDQIAAFREFIKKYDLTPESAEGWWLYSYWG